MTKRNPFNKVPFRGQPYAARDWAAHSDQFLVDQYIDALAAGDPLGDAAVMAIEVTRRGLIALAEATVSRRAA